MLTGRNGCRARHGRRVRCCRIDWRTVERLPLIADRPERLQGRHVAGRLPLIALQTGRGRLAKRTACFRRARTWAERRTACKAVFDGLATNPAKRRGTGANGCRDCRADGQRLNGRRAESGTHWPESARRVRWWRLADACRNPAHTVAACRIDWRTVAAESGAAFDIRHGRTVARSPRRRTACADCVANGARTACKTHGVFQTGADMGGAADGLQGRFRWTGDESGQTSRDWRERLRRLQGGRATVERAAGGIRHTLAGIRRGRSNR